MRNAINNTIGIVCIAITTAACGGLASDPGQAGLTGAKGDNGQVPMGCYNDSACAAGEFCKLDDGMCLLPTFNIQQGTCTARPEACYALYAPVCGCDGNTYGNDCDAAASGVSVASQGECQGTGGNTCTGDADCAAGQYCGFDKGMCMLPTFNILQGECTDQPTACTRELAPVCGCDGNTYSNACGAAAAGVSVASDGACQGGGNPGTCTADSDCATGQYCKYDDGMCMLPTFNILQGECTDQPTACTREFAPVCGCDGNTYGNACGAAAAGVSVASTGTCF